MESKYIAIAAAAVVVLGAVYIIFSSSGADQAKSPEAQGKDVSGEVREFSMTSFYEMVDDKPKPQFSVRGMQVKKGDKVRIKVTNTKGVHDFVIDEFNVRAETPLNQEVVVEFVADKAGEFAYYCSKPNHRELGQWGTLKVVE